MKKSLKNIAAGLTLLSAAAVFGASNVEENLEAKFKTPEDVTTSVYWYWVSDHISKDGVIKDLHAMKEQGINRAFIGNIGLGAHGESGVGNVKFQSKEWWEAMHAALKTATELGIEIGIFNSPGWSQSGGPWVKPSQAMRYLKTLRADAEGGGTIELAIPAPENFQDVKVIAYPSYEDKGVSISAENAKIKSQPEIENVGALIDGNPETFAWLPKGGNISIEIEGDKPQTIRSLRIKPGSIAINTPATFFAKIDGEYKPLADFVIDRYNFGVGVGFDPHAPIVISIPATTAKDFKLEIKNLPAEGTVLHEVAISSMPYVERYPEKTLAKMYQQPLPFWHEYQWRPQPEINDESLAIHPSEIIDITEFQDGDKIVWNDAPEGKWTILRLGMMPTGAKNGPAHDEASGLETDKMSKEHIEAHFNAYMGEILKRIPAKDRKTWKVIVEDSYETGGQNFTDGFLEEFFERYGYDPVPFLPVFSGQVVISEDISDRFLWDLRRLVADKVAYDYVGGLREVANRHGLTTWLENYGHWGFPGEFLQYGGQSDEIAGEFWSEGSLGDLENRAASSCGHIYGKNKISAESFTSGFKTYGRYPALMKQRGDRFFSEGINNTLLHLYLHQPYDDKEPGVNAWFGNEFNRKNTWFSHMGLFTDYIKRANLMLQQGLNVADIAYFIGEDAPKMTGITDPAPPKGYQFDYINAEVIEKNLSVKNGLLTLPHGTQYKILVLPPLETMRPELLEKIMKLVKDGAVVMGNPPARSPSLENYPDADESVKAMAKTLWNGLDGENVKAVKFGKGHVLRNMGMQEALDYIKCQPDVKLAENDPVLYGHRTAENLDIYFITNQSEIEIEFAPEFRVTGKQPELWDAVSGSKRPLKSFKFTDDATTLVPMRLAPLESAFVVFKDDAENANRTDVAGNFPELKTVETLKGPWTLTFEEGKRGPEKPLVAKELSDISKSEDFNTKHFSGKIDYDTVFTLKDKGDKNYFVDLGEVGVMAKVYVNGKYAGGAWTPPYRVDITDFVQNGKNELKVVVATTWMNRLIGDLNLPESERKTFVSTIDWTKDSPLQPSGLMGPVTIESAKY